MWSIAGTSKLLPVLKRRLRQRRLYFGSPRAPYILMLFASCDGKLAEPCSQDNIDIWGCGDGAAVVQFLSSLGVS